ncbi:MAG: PAS domain S-box protein [Spirochaetales bacterium]|nr:PAS domain S-box protein [Spirochaetales bacterium]MCF7938014.1 PAS domain S-box protein [Spirochaetales bacterium]
MSDWKGQEYDAAKFQSMFQLNPRACLLWDMELHVLDWNKAAEKTFGYKFEEIEGKTLSETLLEGLADGDEVVASIKDQLHKSRDGFQNINKNKRKDGIIITCDWYNSPVFDEEGNPLFLISEAVDITKDMKREESKKELAPYILEKSQELDTIFSEFQKQLTSVNNQLLDTANSITANRQENEDLSKQLREINVILHSMEDILDISHINQINLRIQASRLRDSRNSDAFKIIGSHFDGANKKIEELIQELSSFYENIQEHLSAMQQKFSDLLSSTDDQKNRIKAVSDKYYEIQGYFDDFHEKVSEYLKL